MGDATILAAKRFGSTTRSCYIGCLAQGTIMNFAPLFFTALRMGELVSAIYPMLAFVCAFLLKKQKNSVSLGLMPFWSDPIQ